MSVFISVYRLLWYYKAIYEIWYCATIPNFIKFSPQIYLAALAYIFYLLYYKTKSIIAQLSLINNRKGKIYD